jgi:hypothetical protein
MQDNGAAHVPSGTETVPGSVNKEQAQTASKEQASSLTSASPVAEVPVLDERTKLPLASWKKLKPTHVAFGKRSNLFVWLPEGVEKAEAVDIMGKQNAFLYLGLERLPEPKLAVFQGNILPAHVVKQTTAPVVLSIVAHDSKYFLLCCSDVKEQPSEECLWLVKLDASVLYESLPPATDQGVRRCPTSILVSEVSELKAWLAFALSLKSKKVEEDIDDDVVIKEEYSYNAGLQSMNAMQSAFATALKNENDALRKQIALLEEKLKKLKDTSRKGRGNNDSSESIMKALKEVEKKVDSVLKTASAAGKSSSDLASKIDQVAHSISVLPQQHANVVMLLQQVLDSQQPRALPFATYSRYPPPPEPAFRPRVHLDEYSGSGSGSGTPTLTGGRGRGRGRSRPGAQKRSRDVEDVYSGSRSRPRHVAGCQCEDCLNDEEEFY